MRRERYVRKRRRSQFRRRLLVTVAVTFFVYSGLIAWKWCQTTLAFR